jgi:hypothetical protein
MAYLTYVRINKKPHHQLRDEYGTDGPQLVFLNLEIENTLLKLIYLISIFSHSASENFVAY